ncbi:FAD-dependent monooxygenase [Pseudokineococcus sp. 1T1Z-3]|uniref:FAD-dependent monooxygenase n=1 Tax=Pseudokineococcus sp. 1T1Z-3 TaxID=3132745 RepID=UPI00309CF7FC
MTDHPTADRTTAQQATLVQPTLGRPDVDVLVVGAGPAGATLTADLLRRGVRVRLLDRAPQPFAGSRAKGVQPRTLEVLEDLGVLSQARSQGGEYPLLGLHVGPVTVPWRMQQRRRPTSAVPYPNILLLPQHRTDAVLHDLVRRDGGQVELGTGVDAVAQDGAGVTATLSTGEQVRAAYLVGADGGSSTVRRAAGLRFEGATDDSDRTLLVDAEVEGLSRSRWHVWPRTGGTFVGACPLPHSRQFQVMIRLDPDAPAPATDEASVAARFAELTGHRLHSVTWTSVFRPNVRLVEGYRAGRVLLAGDAAHVHTPAGGQGMNTGIQDAYNLGWKLQQVLAGAPDALLDSYDGERRPVAARVLGRSSELYAGMGSGTRLASLRRGDQERQITLSYRGGPLAPADAPATSTLHVGDRAPDAPCEGEVDGRPVRRLFDVFRGPHFTALVLDGGDGDRVAAQVAGAWPQSGARLRTALVRGDGPAGPGVLLDRSGAVARTYGATPGTSLLVRPDGYVGAVVTGGADGLVEAARALLPC